jgi:hypothetical protein
LLTVIYISLVLAHDEHDDEAHGAIDPMPVPAGAGD